MRFGTDKELKALPKDKRAYHKDALLKNLYVAVFPSQREARLVFYYRYRTNNKAKEVKLGAYPILSLAQARAKTNELNLRLETTGDIQENPITIVEIYNEWIKTNEQKDRGLYLHIISKYANKPLKDLTKQDVLVCLDKLHKENKRESIKRVFGRLCKLIKYAINREYIESSAILNIDIVAIYGRVESTPFKAITDLETFKELLQAIESYKGDLFTQYALKISPYLALRDSTMRNLKWEYIDFKAKQINIPANIMKSKEVFIIPLSESVLKLFAELKPYSAHSPYCFPSDYSKSKVMSENTLNLAIKRLGFGDLMVYHGFRTTFSTFAYENKKHHKQDSEVIELCLDHRERNKVKAVYNRSLRLDDRRELMQWWSDFIDKLRDSD